jgi:hypothetical protein
MRWFNGWDYWEVLIKKKWNSIVFGYFEKQMQGSLQNQPMCLSFDKIQASYLQSNTSHRSHKLPSANILHLKTDLVG